MHTLLALFTFAFGTVIGSFLNAVLWRLRTGEGFVFGRSYCPRCHHELGIIDLVPVFSYVWLKGRCRHCRQGIAPSYLLIELAAGLAFLAVAWPYVATGEPVPPVDLARLLLGWYFAAVLIIVFVYDLRYMLILRSVTLPASVVAFAGNTALGADPVSLLLAVVIGGGIFFAQHRLSGGRWVGGGDIQLGILMGAMLGWPHVLVALFLAYVGGAFVAVGLLLSGRKSWKSQIPLGTFLAAASVATLLWGDRILGWYLGVVL